MIARPEWFAHDVDRAPGVYAARVYLRDREADRRLLRSLRRAWWGEVVVAVVVLAAIAAAIFA